jgi:membrane-associated phospholipid phosphatase
MRVAIPWPEAWRPLPCAVATSAAYAALYTLSNHVTSWRSDIGAGVFAWERGIPFVGWTVVPYLSICVFFALSFFIDADAARLRRHVLRLLLVLFVSVLCYAAFPLRFTFERPPTEGAIGLMFDLLGHCDMPYNRAPSLHIGVLVLLWARFAPLLRGAWAVGLHGWFALIGVSVLTTYQHHVLDVPAGAALGIAAIVLTMRPRRATHSTRASSTAQRAAGRAAGETARA